MPRIISGTVGGRRLESPRDTDLTRPYPDRVKESVCNLLRGWFEDAVVVDLFAGVGTMALEAASRGAARVVAVERDRRVARYLRENIEMLGLGDRVEVLMADALAPTTLTRIAGHPDLIFIDPPYALMRDAESRQRVLEQAVRCGQMLARPGFLVLRTPERPDRVPHPVAGLEGPEVHAYASDMYVLLYAPPPEPGEGDGDGDAAGDSDVDPVA
ncbi:MAG: RsmD family RNA methyltransferase [Planctomycetota bacterium]|jgi:16S rRNA (guanine966-N2)-methyltransferase